jgi:hypothetical protein
MCSNTLLPYLLRLRNKQTDIINFDHEEGRSIQELPFKYNVPGQELSFGVMENKCVPKGHSSLKIELNILKYILND